MIEVPQVAKAFRGPGSFSSDVYRLLPFRFNRLDALRYVVTNISGEHLVLGHETFNKFVRHQLETGSETYNSLKSKHFLMDAVSDVALDLLAIKYRTKQSQLPSFTALHIFVVTLRCDHSCPYCQVSRVSQDKAAFDMSTGTADKAIGLMFRSPSNLLKVEFQGGESLLNFDLVKHIVLECERRNDGRDIEFVIATNLSPLTDDMLMFCREHGIIVSTSLDGPAELHNANRPRPGGDSHQRAIDGIRRVRDALGPDSVSALMTTTQRSLDMPEAIIDEYLAQGFRSVFLRPISPFGFAVRSRAKIGYETESFLNFYKRGLDYVLSLNKQGVGVRENYTGLILRKMMTPYPTGYVDLQSPSGLGITVIVYNYDGDVYASDEGRTLAETNDKTFRLGNVQKDSYESLFLDSGLIPMMHKTMAEGIPGCVDCAYLPWCGTDPLYHHATQGDPVGIRPMSGYCRRNMGTFDHIVKLLADDEQSRGILLSWVSQ